MYSQTHTVTIEVPNRGIVEAHTGTRPYYVSLSAKSASKKESIQAIQTVLNDLQKHLEGEVNA